MYFVSLLPSIPVFWWKKSGMYLFPPSPPLPRANFLVANIYRTIYLYQIGEQKIEKIFYYFSFNRTVPLGMERFNPVIFLDLNGT